MAALTLEQGRVAPDLTDDGVTALQRRPDHRPPHVPSVEQQTQRTEAAANRPQQRLGQGDLPDMTDAAAQARLGTRAAGRGKARRRKA